MKSTDMKNMKRNFSYNLDFDEIRDLYTLDEIENSSEETLAPKQVANILGISLRRFTEAARKNPELLGFPVAIIGKQIFIPKRAFLNFMNGKKSK